MSKDTWTPDFVTAQFGAVGVGRSPAGRRITADGERYQREREARAERGRSSSPVPPPPAAPAPLPSDRNKIYTSGPCHRIIAEVSEKHGIPVKDILSERRAWALIPARHEAIYRCVAETSLSLPAIGRVFNRDHTTIGASVMRHHVRTGAPLPRGMAWVAGVKVRHGGEEPKSARRSKGSRSTPARIAALEAARQAIDAELTRLRAVEEPTHVE